MAKPPKTPPAPAAPQLDANGQPIPGTTPAPTTAADKKNAPRVAPVLTDATTAFAMPERDIKRGSATNYPFASLTAVGMSFGVKNKTAANMASIVSNQNRKLGAVLKNADGSTKYKTQPMLDANGNVIGQVPVTPAVEERETMPHYFAWDVPADKINDPANGGATVRVFRDK